jgi:hypothetical protein
MNGAIAEPWVAISSAPNNAIVTDEPKFLTAAQEGPELAYKATHLTLSQNCRLILDAPPAGGSRSMQ